jgi:flagellar secretion chaperone FliS
MYRPSPHAANARDPFASDALATASNARILVMCFDRMDRDLATALAAMERGDHFATNDSLQHAQDLLDALVEMLDLDAWEHADSLLTVYDYALRLLAKANVLKAEALVVEARRLIGELGEAFRTAASGPTDEAAAVADDPDRAPLSIRA